MKVALLGTGRMGAPMGARLLAAGHRLTIWNRTPEKTELLAGAGAEVAGTPAEAVSGAEATILMLLNGPAVSHVLFEEGVATALAPGSLLIDMSSIPPALAREHSRRLEQLGRAPIDAPVSGGVGGARAGSLAIMAGGRAEDVARAAPLLRAMGELTHVGPSGTGQISKCVNQLIVAVTIGAVAEGLVLARESGADPVAVRGALLGGWADSPILREHGERMLERAFAPGATATGQLKDLRAIEELASERSLALPLASRVTGLFAALAAGEHSQLDHSALILEIERLNADAGPQPVATGATTRMHP